MSYDLKVWTVNEVSLSDALPDSAAWNTANKLWSYKRRTWQVLVGKSVRALPEDLPHDASRTLPGIGFLTELSLSPIDSSESARKFLLRTATAIAKAARGVIFDPQANTLTLPSGIQRFVKRKADENATVIVLSWWFTEGPAALESRYDLLLDALEAELPEALPRRYGSLEPPQHVYADTGRDHFLGFLSEHLGQIVVWYPTAPVASVHLGVPDIIGFSKRGFRSAYFTIDVDIEALDQSGWQIALKRLWRRVSHTVQPFYGDVRTLHGYRRKRDCYWLTRTTAQHPVRAWWWCGLPPGPAQAIVLGPPYCALWPAFKNDAVVEAELAFVDTGDWRVSGNVLDIVGPAPVVLNQIGGRHEDPAIPREYPAQWPFPPPLIS